MKKSPFILPVCLAAAMILITIPGCEKEENNTPPVAEFSISPETGTIETIFSFDASGCSDGQDQSAAALQVRWDWENDGDYDTEFSTNKEMNHQFYTAGTYQVTLEVRDAGGLGDAMTRTLEVGGIIPTVTTDTVRDIGINSAICDGNVITDQGMPVIVRGTCWSTSPQPTVSDEHTTDGSGTGTFSSQLTGLTKNTLYYVRAYATNEIGTAYGEEKQFRTLNLWLCGDPIAVSHIAGDVAPVNKAVTYGTVTNIEGAPGLCWITSNLGANHQASAVDDATEASAGWYWQFNRKQGHYHDGINRIPNIAWIEDITEDSDWTYANDPCAIELGSGWRVPTQAEYVNIEQWTNWNGPWNSALKLHAAGFISLTGDLSNIGVQGYVWSNLQGDWNVGWYMRWSVDASTCAGNYKAYALPMRCAKD